ncbi:two-component system sensor histidine kinase NtrB [Alkalilacustris brevis]|uniref:two-component system sensor histidine kinase NtrB n=1 Tax=Alkalilacustris brevis TaxID=2026338 RepID=UPI000E0D7F3C|nr:ATP-binding protein [Alkalilacustris brevis]
MNPPEATRLWTSLPIPAFIIGDDDTIIEVNPAGEAFVNVSARVLRAAPAFDRLVIDADMPDACTRVRRNQAPLFLNDAQVGTGERAPVMCNIQVAPLADDPGRLLMLITPREIAGRLGQANSVASAAKAAIGMSAMLAHEIKNPLAGITGAAQLLSMSLDKDGRELTDLIVEESRRVVKLLEQVEQFGNLRPPDLKPVNIHDVLDRARRSAVVGFAAHMTILEDYDPSLPPALVDRDQLLQVVQNLLKNASEAAGDAGGTIRLRSFYDLSLRMRGRALPLQIEIIDDGPGLPSAIAGDVFEPFVSGRENGTGLGLALVSKIISEHDGWVAVDSVPGRTAFRISLPVATTLKEAP